MTLSGVDDEGLREVCRAWFGGCEPTIRPLIGDGFSGASLVRVSPGDGAADVVLKSFPVSARPRVEWVHALTRHLREAGCGEAPEVVATPSGATLVGSAGWIWEAVRFVEGATTDAPDPSRAAAAAAALARLHVAAAPWPAAAPTRGIAPAMTRRIDHASRLLAAPWQAPMDRPRAGDALANEMVARLERAAAIAREAGLSAALRRVVATQPAPLPLQAVLRDVWSGHVLFADGEPARVAGIVDLHAASIDTPATDVARLLGSWRRDPAISPGVAWPQALAAYEAIRPLAVEERRLVSWLEATGTILGLDNWFRWVLAEGRRFERPARVLERVDRLVAGMAGAIARLDGHGHGV
jgi:Ser/Thr protein kinase RdoA (MazF antagonist)